MPRTRHRPARHLRAVLLASTIVGALGAAPAFAQDMPHGGVVSAGSATITATPSAMTIRQASDRAVIDWQHFSIGTGGQVTIEQPGAGSALLNRVRGPDMSVIAGNLTSNGQVFLINPNGVVIDQTGKVQARGGFVASTLDIRNDDFMAGRLTFRGGGTGLVANRGYVSGGAVALLGSQVANDGVIVSRLGRVAMGVGQQATLDLNGDGLLQVAIPSELAASTGTALLTNKGMVDAAGGTVVMKVAAAREIVRQAVNMSGVIRATSVGRAGGSVLLDGDDGAVEIAGMIDASGRAAGQQGGRIDVTGGDVALVGATLSTAGQTRGGLIRIGGAFQGGTPSPATDAALTDRFTTRFGSPALLRAARTTTIDAASTLDSSGEAMGGTVVAWSQSATRQAGTVNVAGLVGGAVELSSKGTLTTALSRVATGQGGTLLLDPKDISVYSASSFGNGTNADPVSATVGYADGPGTAQFNVADIQALINGGTDVVLRASNDVNWSADLTGNLTGTTGSLSLSAGRSVTIGGTLRMNRANLTVIANDTAANGVVDADRDYGAGEIDALWSSISGAVDPGGAGGNIRLTIGSGTGLTNGRAGGIRLTPIWARSITIDAGTNTVKLFDDGAGTNPATFFATDAISLTGNIQVAASGGLTLKANSIDWTNEASARLAATSPNTEIRFVENNVTTRYGVLDADNDLPTADTARIALGKGANGAGYGATYGNAYGAFDTLHLVSGALKAGDTLDGLLATGSVGVSGPASGLGVGDYAVTASATSNFGLASGVTGYFVDLRNVTDTLRIAPRALTATALAGNYIYGSPTAIATLSGLIGNDSVGLTANISGIGTQALIAGSGGFTLAPNIAVGQRSFTLAGLTGAAAANYTLTGAGAVGAALTITPRTVTYVSTAPVTTSTYGTLNPAGFLLLNTVGQDDVSVTVTGLTRNGVTSALTAMTPVGSYTPVASGLMGAAAGNYVLDTTNSIAGSVVVNPKALTYTTVNVGTTYGTLAALGTPVLSGVVGNDDVGAVATLNGGALALDARLAVGSYAINAALTGSGTANYVLSDSGSSVGQLSIARKTLTVTLADTSQVWRSPVAVATLNGVLSGDDVNPVGLLDNSSEGITALAGNGVGFLTPDVGSHRFTLMGISGLGASNYVLARPSVQTATLTVTPRLLNYAISSGSVTYGNGLPDLTIALSGVIDPPTLPLTAAIMVIDPATGISTPLQEIGRLAAGTYSLVAGSLTGTRASNYMIAGSDNQFGTLTVTPRPITYGGLSASGIYGNAIGNPGAVLLNALYNDDLSAQVEVLSGTRVVQLGDRSPVGSYRVTVTGITGSAASNYVLTGGTDGAVTITPREIYYQLGTGTTNYGSLAKPDVILKGVLAGDAVTPIIFADGAAMTDRLSVGSYQSSVGGLGGAQGGNYVIAASGNMPADIVVRPAPLTFSVAAATSVFGDPMAYAPVIWSGLMAGDTAPAATIGISSANLNGFIFAGTYTPRVETTVSGNYYFAGSTIGQYVVTPRPITLRSSPVILTTNSYGLRADQILGTVTVDNQVGTDPLGFTATPQNVTLSSGGYVNAGSYALKINATLGTQYGNYVVQGIDTGSFTVQPRYLGTTPRLDTSVYGTTATLQGYQPTPLNGDIVAFVLAVEKDGQIVAPSAQLPVGSYVLRATALSGADAGNYQVDPSQIQGALSVTPKTLTYATGNVQATYGTLTALGTATLNGVVGADQVTGVNVAQTGYEARTAVGSYTLMPVLTGAAASNYMLGFGQQGTLTVAPRPLSVTYAQPAQTWTYGTSVDGTGFTRLNGVLDGDSVSLTPQVVLTGTGGGNPLTLGTYYAIDGKLNAGSYVVSATGASGFGALSGASAGNYVLTTGSSTNAAPTFAILPREITGVLTLPGTAVYGDAPALSVAFNNTVGGVALSYGITATNASASVSRDLGQATSIPANLAAGVQYLSVSLTGLDSYNYLIVRQIMDHVTITPRPVSIEQFGFLTPYATATSALYRIAGMVAGDDVAPMIGFAGDAAVRGTSVTDGFGLPTITHIVGAYATRIDALTGSAAANYVLTGGYTGSLIVQPKTITYTTNGFSAQYGGLTLPTCPSGCEMTGQDNHLQVGAVTLNGILPSDANFVRGVTVLSGQGRAAEYARNTPPGTYLQVVNSLEGSQASNYILARDGNAAGVVFILPGWVRASISGGGRLYTNFTNNQYVSLGTPGVVTISRSNNLTDVQGGNSFLPGEQVSVYAPMVDSNGNIVDPTTRLAIGNYTINPVALVGPQSGNYRLVPEGNMNGPGASVAGTFNVQDQSVFNFSFLTKKPTGIYIPPAAVSLPEQSGPSLGSASSVAYEYGLRNKVITQANVSAIIKGGPVTIDYRLFTEASAKFEVDPVDMAVIVSGGTRSGFQEKVEVAGNLGKGLSGSVSVTGATYVAARGGAEASVVNGLSAETFVGVGASYALGGSLSGKGVTGSMDATLYTPGSLGVDVGLNTGYGDHTVKIGFTLGLEIGIGGLKLSPNISFNTRQIETYGEEAANAYVELGQKIVGTYCGPSCKADRAKAEAAYQAEVNKALMPRKLDAAWSLTKDRKPTWAMMQYLQENPDLVRYVADHNDATSFYMRQAIQGYEDMVSSLQGLVARETDLKTRLAASDSGPSADDLTLAQSLQQQEKSLVDRAYYNFGMHIKNVDGEITFGK